MGQSPALEPHEPAEQRPDGLLLLRSLRARVLRWDLESLSRASEGDLPEQPLGKIWRLMQKPVEPQPIHIQRIGSEFSG